VWFEITTLLIPGLNDSDAELDAETRWIADELGPDVPVHFTAFHPDYKLLDRPATPPATLSRARRIALGNGLRFVYTGNVHDPPRARPHPARPLPRLPPRHQPPRPPGPPPAPARPAPPHRPRQRAALRLHRQRPRPRRGKYLLPRLRDGRHRAGLVPPRHYRL